MFTLKQTKECIVGSNSSQGGAFSGVFLLGQLVPLPYGSRRLCELLERFSYLKPRLVDRISFVGDEMSQQSRSRCGEGFPLLIKQ